MAIIFPHPQYSVRTHSHTSCSPLEIEDKIAVSQLNSELSSYQQICKLWISLYDPGGQRAGDLATGGLGPGHQPPVTPPTTHHPPSHRVHQSDFGHYYYIALN